jgi:hypothetical protein
VLEAQRMTAEKAAAMLEAQAAAGIALATGSSSRAAARDGVLKLENIGKLAIVAIGPHHRAGS